MTTSLYDRLGGADAIDAAVDIFYGKVLSDESINGFFTSTNMVKQRKHQKAFLTMAFGGPKKYKGENMRKAHAKYDLNEEHFDAVVGHLASTLTELGVSNDDIAEVATIANSIKDDVLNR